MAQVRFVTGAKKSSRIIDTSTKVKALDPAVVKKAFNAKPAGSSAGMDLFAIRSAMQTMLQSSGGRPALEGVGQRVKIPKIGSDWEKLEKLARAAGDLKHKPSTGQMAAVVLHLGLMRISEEELKEAARKEFG